MAEGKSKEGREIVRHETTAGEVQPKTELMMIALLVNERWIDSTDVTGVRTCSRHDVKDCGRLHIGRGLKGRGTLSRRY